VTSYSVRGSRIQNSSNVVQVQSFRNLNCAPPSFARPNTLPSSGFILPHPLVERNPSHNIPYSSIAILPPTTSNCNQPSVGSSQTTGQATQESNQSHMSHEDVHLPNPKLLSSNVDLLQPNFNWTCRIFQASRADIWPATKEQSQSNSIGKSVGNGFNKDVD
jgi:hypothetical protein